MVGVELAAGVLVELLAALLEEEEDDESDDPPLDLLEALLSPELLVDLALSLEPLLSPELLADAPLSDEPPSDELLFAVLLEP